MNEKSKDEVLKILEKCRAKNTWDRFFECKIEIDNLQNKLQEVRDYRNYVAHSKNFHKDNYEKFNTLLNKLIKQIGKAISDIETRTFSESNISDSIVVFAEAMRLYSNKFSIEMAPIVRQISKMTKEMSKMPMREIKFNIPQKELSNLLQSQVTTLNNLDNNDEDE
ncbi:Swt1 family HEPN domain-containing protein [Senegalia massiliensis]|uniref:Swt1 family HEPN domain-containing protein n=1 Tax=Senegalia massiliensis TaxID=1720316 RepID=UPI001361FA5B